MPLILPTNSELSKLVKYWQLNQAVGIYNPQGFVAATMYTISKISALNYYSSQAIALKQLYYLAGEKGYTKQTASGAVQLRAAGNETVLINAQYFVPVPYFENIPLPYEVAKYLIENTKTNFLLVRGYTPQGKGPVYMIYSRGALNIAAQKIATTGDKLKEAQEFYNNLQLIKANYNSIVATLNDLISKPFNPATQQTINLLSQKRQTMMEQIREIEGVTIVTGTSGQISGIGIIPVAAILILSVAGVAGWSIATWIKNREKSQRIRDSYNHQVTIKDEQARILAAIQSGSLDKETGAAALKNLGIAMATAEAVAKESAKDKGGLADVAKYLMFGLLALAVAKIASK